MDTQKAESLARKAYKQWRAKQISTKRARTLLSKLPHCETVDMIWCAISYDGVGMNAQEFAQA